jgi:4-hydroxybenzoyl-CoA thioesterase
MPYLTNITARRIEWGECDPAGIVFYPCFFAMFDNATTLLFSAALGMTKYQFLNKYDCAGYPMVDTRARFLIPARFGDDVTIESSITEIKRSSFQVTHHLKKDGAFAVECFETRVWTGRDPSDPSKIRSQPIPAEVIAKLSLP